jgi:hypothetical protein
MDTTNRLTNIETQEVSIVTAGANKQPWLLRKAADLLPMNAVYETRAKALKGDQEAIKAVLKELMAQISDETLKELGLQRTVEEAPATEVTTDQVENIEAAAATGSTAVASTEETKKLQEEMNKLKEENQVLKASVNKLGGQVSESQTVGDVVKKAQQVSGFFTLGCKPLRDI